MILAIHTVFILKENILFIEEWIDYHLSIGFSKFYLYDNSKSIIRKKRRKPALNRYGIDFNQASLNIEETELERRFTHFLTKYKNKITYIKWEPMNLHGHVIYGQKKSIEDYFVNYANETDWTAFIDIDEFIYSARDLKSVLKRYEQYEIADVVLFQKKFDDRFNNFDKPVVEIVDCLNGIDTTQWGPKHLFRNCYFDFAAEEDWNIHFIPFKNCYASLADIKTLRFNHYNINSVQLQWMKSFYHTDYDFKLNGKCYELLNKAKALKKQSVRVEMNN